MSKEETEDLIKFLKPFTKEIQELALWLREFVWDLYPDCNELIYNNYNAVAFGWSTSEKQGEIFCSVAVYNNKAVHFGFYRGADLTDPEKKLLGNGNQYRFIRLAHKNDLPKTYIKKLLKEAHKNSLEDLKGGKQILKGATITKSISAKKKRPK